MKQAILVRVDLNMSKGKTSAQVAHASVEAVQNSDKNSVNVWRSEGAKKVVLKVANEKELLDFHRKARVAKLSTALITDAGRTEVAPGTKTCLGIGPDKDERIDKITSSLKML
tara:strand:- start:494 stop:832 length:339 start_codon:yes stop_codon:yes gene_type:complete